MSSARLTETMGGATLLYTHGCPALVRCPYGAAVEEYVNNVMLTLYEKGTLNN